MRVTVFWKHRPARSVVVNARRIGPILSAVQLDGGAIDAVLGQSTAPVEITGPLDPDPLPVLYAHRVDSELVVERWPIGDGMGRSGPDADEYRRCFYDTLDALFGGADHAPRELVHFKLMDTPW